MDSSNIIWIRFGWWRNTNQWGNEPNKENWEAIASQILDANAGLLERRTDKWYKTQLFYALKEKPEVLDSSQILYDFYTEPDKEVLLTSREVTKAMEKGVESKEEKDTLEGKNEQLSPQDQHEDNMKALNGILLDYYSYSEDTLPIELDTLHLDEITETQPDTLPTEVLEQVMEIAKQCYVEGGPSVLEARSLLEVYNILPDLSYQDNCLQNYGSYKMGVKSQTTTTSYAETKFFDLFPNPVESENIISLLSSEFGTLFVYDNLGRIMERKIVEVGITKVVLTGNAGIYNYVFKGESGMIRNGKIVLL